jgi:hypothetical protein|tara:strand:- start:1281 stop:1487 length:207 start_codon:yes stop_codon:yes gene_type:complete
MPAKIKPSQKEYIKDGNGRPTRMWRWKHYYLKQATTEEIQKELAEGKNKHKNKLLNELQRRGVKSVNG